MGVGLWCRAVYGNDSDCPLKPDTVQPGLRQPYFDSLYSFASAESKHTFVPLHLNKVLSKHVIYISIYVYKNIDIDIDIDIDVDMDRDIDIGIDIDIDTDIETDMSDMSTHTYTYIDIYTQKNPGKDMNAKRRNPSRPCQASLGLMSSGLRDGRFLSFMW